MSKLDECANTLRSSAFDENDVMSMINTCKDYLQKYHDAVNINLPKVNSETKEIINSIKRIDPNDYPGIPNPENVFPQLAKGIIFSQSNDPHASDRNEVANVLLTMNPDNENVQKDNVSKFPVPKNGSEFSVEEFCTEAKSWHAKTELRGFTNFHMQHSCIPVKI